MGQGRNSLITDTILVTDDVSRRSQELMTRFFITGIGCGCNWGERDAEK